MPVQLGGEPDRLINDLYVWIVEDKRTSLQGIFSINLDGLNMQCACSSLAVARKIGEKIKELPYANKKFTLFRYRQAEELDEV